MQPNHVIAGITIVVSSLVSFPSAAQQGQSLLDILNNLKSLKQQAQKPGHQQAPQQNAPQSGTVVTDGQPQNPAGQPSDQGATAAWTPPSDTPIAPVKVDPSKMPDIVGLRLGMSPPEVEAVLKKRHSAKINVNTYNLLPFFPANKKVLDAFFIGYQQLPAPDEKLIVHFTPPNGTAAGKQVAWRIRRELHRQKIDHANVIASLREKYGKESAALNGGQLTADGSQIDSMWWVLDGQGHAAPLPSSNDLYFLLNRCAGMLTDGRDEPGHIPFGTSDVADNTHTFDETHQASSWCNSAGITLWAQFSTAPIVDTLVVEAVDMPAALHAARQESEWLRGLANRERQRQIDEAKQARPSL